MSVNKKLARKMRWQGESFQAIADHFGVTRQRIHQICAGVICPIDHRRENGLRPETIERLRNHAASFAKHSDETIADLCALRGIKSAGQIAKEYGFASKNVVIGIWNRARSKGKCNTPLLQAPRRVRA